jgi:hypothetical protein
MNADSIVRAAIYNSTVGSLMRTLETRNPGPKNMGSVFTIEKDIHDLLMALWEEYKHPAVEAPAQAFKASIGGYVKVQTMAWAKLWFGLYGKMALIDSHKDPKNPAGSGFVEACIEIDPKDKDVLLPAMYVDHTTILIGPGDQPEKQVVWTFFPGDPIQPSKVKDDGLHNKIVTWKEAAEMGFKYVKLIG